VTRFVIMGASCAVEVEQTPSGLVAEQMGLAAAYEVAPMSMGGKLAEVGVEACFRRLVPGNPL
jgi:hypothetical protein